MSPSSLATFLASNFLGMGVFYLLSRPLWALPGQADLPGGPGDGLYFLWALFPILVIFALTDGFVTLRGAWWAARRKSFRPLFDSSIAIAVVFAWWGFLFYWVFPQLPKG